MLTTDLLSALTSAPDLLSDSYAFNEAIEGRLSNAVRELEFLSRFGVDDPNDLNKIMDILAEAAAENNTNVIDNFSHKLYEARISDLQARSYLAAGDVDKALTHAEDAFNFCKEFPSDLVDESVALYDGFSAAYLENAQNIQEAAPSFAEESFQESLKYDNLSQAVSEGPLDVNAIRVAQSEVGFSSRTPIGTDNIQECIVVALRDSNGRVALAHIDYSTTPESLNEILKHLDQSSPLEAKLVGGRLHDPKGERNIAVAEKFIKDNNINLVAAEIDKGVRAIVIDPETFDIKNATPWKLGADNTLQNGLAASMVSEGNEKPIRLGYDDALGHSIQSVMMQGHQIEKLQGELLEGSPLQAYMRMEEAGSLSGDLREFNQVYEVHKAYNSLDEVAQASLKNGEAIALTEVKAADPNGEKIALSVAEGLADKSQILRAGARLAKVGKAGIIIGAAITGGVAALIEYSHDAQISAADKLLEAGALTSEAHEAYISLNGGVETIMQSENLVGQGLAVFVTTPAAELTAKDMFRDFSNEYTLSQKAHEMLGMSMFDGLSLRGEIAQNAFHALPNSTKGAPENLHSLIEAKIVLAEARDAYNNSYDAQFQNMGGTAGMMYHLPSSDELQKIGEAIKDVNAASKEFQYAFDNVLSDPDASPNLANTLGAGELLKIVAATGPYQSDPLDPAIQNYLDTRDVPWYGGIVGAWDEAAARDEAEMQLRDNSEILAKYVQSTFSTSPVVGPLVAEASTGCKGAAFLGAELETGKLSNASCKASFNPAATGEQYVVAELEVKPILTDEMRI